MEKENTSNEHTEETPSQETNIEKKVELKDKDNKEEKPKKKKKTKTIKMPIWKKILSVFSTILLLILSLNILLLSSYFYSVSSEAIEYILTTLFTLVIIFTIPKTGKISNLFTKKFSEKKPKIFKIIKIVFFVLRAQLILAILGFNIIYGIKDNARPYREIFDHFSDKIILPITPMRMNKLLELIEKNDAITADRNLRDINKYEKRVNISKLAAYNIKFSYERAKQFIEKNETDKAIKEIDQAFSIFNTDNYLENLNSDKLDTLTLFKYLSPDVLYNISDDYLKWSNGKSGSYIGLISSIALLHNPNHPQLTLLTANKEWGQLNVHKARESYRKYVKEMEQEGRGNDIPENIREIVNFEPGFSKTKLLIIYDWTLQKISSGMYNDLFQFLCRNYTYFARYIVMFTKPDESKNIDNLDVYKLVSGNNVYSQRGTNTGVQINSNFVKWAKNNLIPSPNSEVGGIFCTEIYNNRFRDLCRAYASTYLYLNSLEGGFDQQVQNLHYAMEDEEFYGVRYYYNTYRRIWPKYSKYTNSTAYDIFGWWLRRGAGGSAQEFWNALEKILHDYDSAWYDKAQNDLSTVIEYTSDGEDYMDEYFKNYNREEEYDEYGADYDDGDGEYEEEGGVYYSAPSSTLSGIELINFILNLYQNDLFTIKSMSFPTINEEDCENNTRYNRFLNALTKSLVYYSFAGVVNLQLNGDKFSYINYVFQNNNNQSSSIFRKLFGNLSVEQAREEFTKLINGLSNNDKENLRELSTIVIKAYHNYQNSYSPDEENCFTDGYVCDELNYNILGHKREVYFCLNQNIQNYFNDFWKRRANDGTIDDVIEILKLTESLLSKY